MQGLYLEKLIHKGLLLLMKTYKCAGPSEEKQIRLNVFQHSFILEEFYLIDENWSRIQLSALKCGMFSTDRWNLRSAKFPATGEFRNKRTNMYS